MKTGTVSWFLRAYWTRICIVALLNLAWGFYLLTPSRWSSSSRFEQPSVIQPSFTFNPPSIRRPFAKRAVVTLFAANESKREFDTSFADVVVLAHTFMLQKRRDVEFVVAVTGFLGFQKKKSLLRWVADCFICLN
ncbi:hypothetical protein BCR33DRAFT_789147 [Rhizoclosmatium globosum]|uniref:Uncharacterized protein n=1 Tax=Rhizoclosmatium globosum TaxID=329046 RepID=A0A1Y2BU07_9FUNG|nr:hypothetical protein BCR33DRAFT_789147 [Rhizoclosmatium globosum]|eukprot:ORY38242.1 hypothetical protein BCR33DRAFT_789147 [Rhizoclosmatium globosum]